jgi:hypothetical protein
MATPVNMKVYADDDDALIIWNVPAARSAIGASGTQLRQSRES